MWLNPHDTSFAARSRLPPSPASCEIRHRERLPKVVVHAETQLSARGKRVVVVLPPRCRPTPTCTRRRPSRSRRRAATPAETRTKIRAALHARRVHRPRRRAALVPSVVPLPELAAAVRAPRLQPGAVAGSRRRRRSRRTRTTPRAAASAPSSASSRTRRPLAGDSPSRLIRAGYTGCFPTRTAYRPRPRTRSARRRRERSPRGRYRPRATEPAAASSPPRLRVVPYERTSSWSSKASDGVERRRGRGLKARDPGRREAPGKVLKDRRSPRERGRMGTSV